MMKKLLAILLATLMLISACAVAEEAAGSKLVIRDVVISMGGEDVLDLSGVDLTLALAGDGTQGALNLAVDAAGSSVLNAIAALDAQGLSLRADGISDVYTISYADLIEMIQEESGADVTEAFTNGFETGFSVGMSAAEGEMPEEVAALIQHFNEIFPNAISDGGTTEIDGVEYAVVEINIGEEQMDVLLGDLAAIVDLYAADRLKENGYDSCAQLFEEQQLRASVDGTVYAGDAETIVSINVNAMTKDETEPETLNIYVDLTEDAANEAMEYYVTLSVLEDDGTEDEIVAFVGTYVEADGEFGEFDLGVYEADSNEAVLYLSVSAPSSESEGLWDFYVSVNDNGESTNFYIDFGSVGGQDQLYAHLITDGQTLYLDYEGANGVGTLSMGMLDGEEAAGGITATVEVAADDGAWLPAAADSAVNMLDIDDAQMEKLSNEGITLLLNGLATLSEANESLAELIGGMMG